MKLEVVLKPCPWCRKTPDIWMPIEDETWCWKISCENLKCYMKPKSPHVSIRKTTKKDFYTFHTKVQHLANIWNGGNAFKAHDMKVIDLDELTELNKSAEYLCGQDSSFKRIEAV